MSSTRKEPLAIEELIAKKKELEEAETKVFVVCKFTIVIIIIITNIIAIMIVRDRYKKSYRHTWASYVLYLKFRYYISPCLNY